MRLARISPTRAAGGLALLAMACAEAGAQNTSSVSSPVVKAGDREAGYRFGWVPDSSGQQRFAHRFDYGFALNGRQSLKLVASISDGAGDDPGLRSVMAEYLLELTPETARVWQSGIRFDASVSDDAHSGALGVDWLNRWTLNDRLQARAMLVASRDWGEAASDAIALELRSSVAYQLDGGLEVSLLAFNELGTTDRFGTGGLPQQAGPAISGALGHGWQWTAGNLFGLSDTAPDNDVRLWLSREF